MKKILILASFLAFTPMANALENANIYQRSNDAYAGKLANESALAYSRNFTYDLGERGIDKISAVVKYGTASFNASTFSDGATSSTTLTVISTVGMSGTLLTVNSVKFRIGYDKVFDRRTETFVGVGADVTDTAHNIITAINANASLGALMVATHNAGAITLVTKAATAATIPVVSDTVAKLAVNDAAFVGGQAATVSASTNKITITGHSLTTGLPVLYANGSTVVGGLATGTTYYVYKVDANNVQLATTSAKAVLADVIDITSVSTDGTAETYFLTPLAMGAANATAKWQISNDGVTFIDHAAASIFVSSATASTSAVAVDFSVVNYRYLNLNVVAPATGGIVLEAQMYMKK